MQTTSKRAVALLTTLLLLLAARIDAQREPSRSPGALANQAATTCRAGLDGDHVAYDVADATPEAIRIAPRHALSSLAIDFVGRDHAHAEMDCRLARALVAWTPALREAGIVGLRHLSAYRAGAIVAGTTSRSGHASGMAVDVRYFDRADGTTWDVITDWGPYERGTPPCTTGTTVLEESTPLRKLVCDAVREGRFQVVVTPNRDADHHDHVHLELVPNVTWTYAR